MSAVSASGVNLFQYLRSISGSNSSQPSPDSSVGATDSNPDGSSSSVQGSHRHHHGHGQLFQKVQSAVSDALQTAQNDPSADPNKTIEDAIAKVLQQAGSSTTDSSTADSTSATNSSASGTDPDHDGDIHTNGQNPSSPAGANSKQAFFQMLQSLGVNADQFHQDFLNAIHDARNGSANPSTALQSLPPGSLIDTTA